jgi:hypothetical protein
MLLRLVKGLWPCTTKAARRTPTVKGKAAAVSGPIASDARGILVREEHPGLPAVRVTRQALQCPAQRRLHPLTEYVIDGLMLLLVVWLLPVAILVLGSPVALLVRVLIEIAKRW